MKNDQTARMNTVKPTGWMYNRPLAVGLTVVVILFACLFGVWKGVRGEYRSLTEAYSVGSDGSGYGIAYYGAAMEEHAANLSKIASKTKYDGMFLEQTEAVADAVLAAGNTSDAGELYDAVQQMIHAVDALNLEMEEAGLDEADNALRLAEHQNFTDKFYKMRNIAVDYNEMAREYNDDVLGSFPANLVAGLLRLPTAEEFS